MTVSHFSVFLKLQICALFGPDKLSERGWIITDCSALRGRLPLASYCGYVTASVGGLSGSRQSMAKTAVPDSSKLVFRTTRTFYADMLCVKLDYYLLF